MKPMKRVALLNHYNNFVCIPPSTFPSTSETLLCAAVFTSCLDVDELSFIGFLGLGETFGRVTTTYCFSTSVKSSS